MDRVEGQRRKRVRTSEPTLVRRGSLTPIGSILQEALKRMDYLPALARHRIFTEWEAIAGPTVSKVAKPERLQGSTLYVSVRDSSWVQHLVFVREGLLRLIQQRLGDHTITKLHFCLDKGERSSKGDQQGGRQAP